MTRSNQQLTTRTLALVLAAAVSAGALHAAGSVRGKVVFRGQVPPTETIPITQDTAVCGEAAERAPVVVGDGGGLRWAVVHIPGGGTAKDGTVPTEIVQEGCSFAPRVTIAPPGVEIGVLNHDNILHNVHTYSEKNAVVNLAQPGFVKRLPLSFTEPERVRVTCDVHSWMEGWVVVTGDRLVAVTDESGAFGFDNVPAGEHEMTVWHPELGEQKARVVVADGEEADVSIEFGS